MHSVRSTLHALVAVSLVYLLSGCRAAQSSCGPALDPPSAPPLPNDAQSCGTIDHWEYHFDRNAIAASTVIGRHVLAIVEAGHIVRFASESLKPTGERLSVERALVWGPIHDGTALAGFAGGRIARVRAETLGIETVARVPGNPQWIGETKRKETIVVYEVGRRSGDGKPLPRRLRFFESGRDISLGDLDPTGFFLDDRDRLWMAEDHGEFGSGVSMADLARPDASCAKLNPIGHGTDAFPHAIGIAKFMAWDDGAILAYGGLDHLLGREAIVTEVPATGPPRNLYRNEGESSVNDRGLREMPSADGEIAELLRIGPGRLMVVEASGGIFETDRTFHEWKRLAEFPVRFFKEGSDSYSDHATVRHAHFLDNRLVLATYQHGYFEIANGKLIDRRWPNQMVASADKASLRGDTLFVSQWGKPPMALRKRTWQNARSLTDPPAPAELPFDAPIPAIAWGSEQRLAVGHAGLSVCNRDGSNCSPWKDAPRANDVYALARDATGRLWLGGRGLWTLDEEQNLVRFDVPGTFLENIEVHDMQVEGDRLVLAMGERGVAIIDTKSASRGKPCRAPAPF